MIRPLVILALASASLALPVQPVLAQGRYTERYIEVYGNDACPQSTENEIVVCARKPEKERYRIPEQLRTRPGNGPNESWANKAEALEYVGRSGPGSCSPSGDGGWTGCWSRLMEQAKAERRQQVQDDANIP